jgi:hypothetical protein
MLLQYFRNLGFKKLFPLSFANLRVVFSFLYNHLLIVFTGLLNLLYHNFGLTKSLSDLLVELLDDFTLVVFKLLDYSLSFTFMLLFNGTCLDWCMF